MSCPLCGYPCDEDHLTARHVMMSMSEKEISAARRAYITGLLEQQREASLRTFCDAYFGDWDPHNHAINAAWDKAARETPIIEF